MRCHDRRRAQLLLSFALLLFPFALRSQTGAANGSIRGVIRDPQSAAISKADVTARNLDTGYTRKAPSDTSGEYSLPLLPIGTYEVTVEAQGFATYTQSGINVLLDKASDLPVDLQLSSAQQTVTVQEDASILTTNTAAVTGGLNERAMQNMPITSRNTFNLALFAPGFNGRRDDEFGNPRFSFGGLQRRAFLIDGIDNTQRGGPGRLGIFSPETIAEVRVFTSTMPAEYGRTVGGMISMITRGGTNDFHGEALTLFRRPGFIARPSLAATKNFSQWATYSGNIGGPIVKNKLFYFASGEYEPLDGPRPITISAANAAALQLPASDLGSAPFAQRFQTYMGRVDYQINDRNSTYVRYNAFVTPSKFNTSGGTLARSAGNNFDDRNDTWASQWTSILSANTVNELRFGSLRREFSRPPVSGVVGPVIAISGVATLNSNTSANQYYREQQLDFVDALSHKINRHQLKFGFDIATIHVTQADRLALTYNFSNLSQYLNTVAGAINPATGNRYNYNTLTQDFGDNTADHRTNSYNFYAQDDFRVRPDFTLNYGVRYEYLQYPSLSSNAPLPNSRNIANDPNNFAPRVGFAWQIGKKTVLRGGYGLFYDTTNLRLISQALRQNGQRVLTYTVNGNSPGAPQYPNAFSAPSPTNAVRPSVTNFSPDFRSLYMHQSNLQVEHALGSDFALTVGTQYFGGRRVPLLLDNNLGAPTSYLADGRPVWRNSAKQNPDCNQIFQLNSVGNSTYYGGFVALTKRWSRSLQFSTSYTFGWAFNENDGNGDSGSNVSDSSNFRRDYGTSSTDQRNRFVLQGVYQPEVHLNKTADLILNRWMFAPNVTWTSGFPFNITQGSDLNFDGVNNDRPLYRGRNDTKGYTFQEVNLRISRTFALSERFRLEVISEAENLFNSLNPTDAVTTFTAPDLLRITSATDSRQIQLGGRLRF